MDRPQVALKVALVVRVALREAVGVVEVAARKRAVVVAVVVALSLWLRLTEHSQS
jgi:hypothetical protein